MSSTPDSVDGLKTAFERIGQGHVFTFWPKLRDDERRILADDLRGVNLSAIPALADLARRGASDAAIPTDLAPAIVTPRVSVSRTIRHQGAELLSKGRVAAFTVAGGQGTRLGFDGPKGAFPISPVRGKTLFQLFAENVLASERRYGTRIPWYIMTSLANDAETQAFFSQHRNFGLREDGIMFFQQGVMPAFDHDGRILLDQPHRLALSPDGHGGSLLAMAISGVLRDMAERGIEQISYFQVDNPLVHCLDPDFIGLHASSNAEMSSKTLPKADDQEKVGNFAMSGGRQVVIEYSDLPEALARARNSDGSRKFDAANIAIHLLSRAFVERLTADRASFALPWHVAKKKVPYTDLQTGNRVEPERPNGVKMEAFIFDALPLAQNPVLMGTSREEEFSPVKNKTGVDSVGTAKRDMSRRATRWLVEAGADIRLAADGASARPCEISPLTALDGDQLRGVLQSRTVDLSRPPAEGIYL